jgi:hypothetical protein
MCRITDLRNIVPCSEKLGLRINVYEVDEDGQATSDADEAFLQSKLTTPEPVPEYMCRAFGS